MLTKTGNLKNDLYLRIFPLTFDEFTSGGYQTPDEDIFMDLPDPAECISNFNKLIIIIIALFTLVIIEFR